MVLMDCCTLENNNNQEKSSAKNICTICGKISKKVEYKTVLMILKYEQIITAKDGEYFYCINPNCNVVYFSNKLGLVYYKKDVRLRIGIKEKKEPKLVCYCFNITEKQITDEIKLTGKSTIPNFITEKIQNKLCACNIKNPSGKCCLGDVKNIKLNN